MALGGVLLAIPNLLPLNVLLDVLGAGFLALAVWLMRRVRARARAGLISDDLRWKAMLVAGVIGAIGAICLFAGLQAN